MKSFLCGVLCVSALLVFHFAGSNDEGLNNKQSGVNLNIDYRIAFDLGEQYGG